ncbi:MAG: hypothetical protein SFX73_30685 [Kofleriaceae bacterium]|nr:hypothetical protein [Kofleriaceae bacterium]
MSTTALILLIVGIFVVQLAIFIPLIGWMRKKAAAITDQMRAALGDDIVWGPAPGYYGGATATYPKAKGNAILAVTTTTLECRRLLGDPLHVSLDRIKAIREDEWFKGSYRGGRMNLILQLDDGASVAFQADDLASLRAAIEKRA